jgi:uncharacterized protein DUF4190/HAAS domain-containing protein
MEQTMNAHTDALVEDYLRRLDAAAARLPSDRRTELVSEIREHLQEGLRQSATDDEVSVRNLLERLGPPEEIVTEAADSMPPSLAAPSPGTNNAAVVSVVLGALWLMGIGSLLALVFGYRARRQIKSSEPRQAGAGLATAGIVLGWVGIALLLVIAAGALGLVASSPPMPVPTR